MEQHTYVFTLNCPDRMGIVDEISRFFAQRGGWIVEADFFTDEVSGRFFARIALRASSLDIPFEQLETELAEEITEPGTSWKLWDTEQRKKIVILATKESHCLHDLLGRVDRGELNVDIGCVISNHQDLRAITEAHGLDYHHVPFPAHAVGKRKAFDEVAAIVEKHEPDAVVLAKFMQILPADLCELWAGRALNIHHSFLPSFMGAKPYHQAYTRGVKLIGATCHFATTDLDDGPIIEQDVIRVSHQYFPDDLKRMGRDVEAQVLARGLRWFLEDRVMVYGNRTVVFS